MAVNGLISAAKFRVIPCGGRQIRANLGLMGMTVYMAGGEMLEG